MSPSVHTDGSVDKNRTVREIVALFTKVPDVPVMVTVTVPVAPVLPTVSVKVAGF